MKKIWQRWRNPQQREEELRLFRRVFGYVLPYKWIIFVGFIASLLVSASTAGTAWLIKPALDELFISKNLEALMYVPVAFIVLTLVKGLGRYVQNWCMNYSGLRMLETLRQELFDKLILLPMTFYESHPIGVLMSRVLNDVALIRQSMPAFVQVIRQTMTMIGLVAVVFYQDFELACWAMIILPVAGAPFAAFSRALRRYGRKNAEVAADISGMLQELLSGVRVIKAFATEKREIAAFNRENGKIVDIALKQTSVAELASPVMELIGSLGIGLVIWYGGREVILGNMTPGTFFSFMAALVMLYEPIKALNAANMNVQQAFAGAERVFVILDDPVLQEEKGGDVPLDEPFSCLEFDNVSLAYAPDAPLALNSISLTIKAGEKVALVGPSGAGKTTLANLLPRFYEPTSGSIRLNGRPLTDYTLPSLRRTIATVSQEAFLFDFSLEENIAYGQTALDKNAVVDAAKAAFAHDFIMALPESYATRVGERGSKLSGGQRQRVTIARALLKNSPLLILDEATSALDSESERMVQRALDNLMKERTSIVIAHRLSTILEADTIVVMEQGQIVDKGSHNELLARCPLYARLCAMQFGVSGANVERGDA